ncbi:MAG: aromatic-ring-hydroxylating dioxygenase subunit beta [Porticoccaceae bacterium]
MSQESHQASIDLIINEGAYLDQKEWDQWLNLYTEDAEYWIPAWDDEHTLTDDPNTQLSLIYYGTRSGLEDRIFRLRTGGSLASTPLPRTTHMTTNFRFEPQTNGDLKVLSSWTTHSYKLKVASYFFGQQTHLIRQTEDGLKIAARKIIVMNDMIANVMDIYSV